MPQPKAKGYAVKICDLTCFVSPCIKHYYVFCVLWEIHNYMPYQGFYRLLKAAIKKGHNNAID